MRKFAVVTKKKGVSAYELVEGKLMMPIYSFWRSDDHPQGFKFYANYNSPEEAESSLEKVGKVYHFREEIDENNRKIWRGL